MGVIGVTPGLEMMALWTGRDLKWTFTNVDDAGNATNFDPGDLFFELAYSTDNGSTPTTKWDFTISGTTATIQVPNTQADLIPAGTKWQLVFTPTGDSTGGDPIAYGLVNRVG